MSRRKRYPSVQFRIRDLYRGEIKQLRDLRYFELDGEDVPRVNLFGVAVDKYDGVTQNNRKFATVRLDDGTDTIQLKVWSRPTEDEEGNIVADPYLLLKPISIGDMLSVIGRVREYNGEFFIDPTTVTVMDDIEWEINQRIQLIQSTMDSKELNAVEDIPLVPVSNSDELTVSEDEDLKSKVMGVFEKDFELNTIEAIAQRSTLSTEVVKEIIEDLKESGEIYMPRPDRFDLIPL
ncbi:MAG: OB-fold nucleic acid binding domain-containing protein [Candidatus Kariarchaeaceae archaeon]|jgi:hypothetical protein